MILHEPQSRTPQLIDQLTAVREASVRATHRFLSDAEIERIRACVPQAVGFYRHMGFEPYKRTERDEEGGPYPLLYMHLKK